MWHSAQTAEICEKKYMYVYMYVCMRAVAQKRQFLHSSIAWQRLYSLFVSKFLPSNGSICHNIQLGKGAYIFTTLELLFSDKVTGGSQEAIG
jgi:hypothetical protein